MLVFTNDDPPPHKSSALHNYWHRHPPPFHTSLPQQQHKQVCLIYFQFNYRCPFKMRISTLAPFLASFALASAETLNVTVLGAHNNKSTLECWALQPGFQTSNTAGTSGTEVLNLGPVGGSQAGNSSYSVLPAEFDGGRHNAPTLQYVSLCLFFVLLFRLFSTRSSTA